MEAIFHGLRKQLRALGQREDGQGGPADVEGGVGVWDRPGQGSPGVVGEEALRLGDQYGRPQDVVGFEGLRPPAGGRPIGQRQPAAEARRHVVGVSFQVDRHLQEPVRRQVGAEQPIRQQDPPDDGRGRRAQPSLERDGVRARQAERRERSPQLSCQIRDGPKHQVRPIGGQLARALSLHADGGHGFGVDREDIGQVQGQGQAVETRPQVGHRGGRADGDPHEPLITPALPRRHPGRRAPAAGFPHRRSPSPAPSGRVP